MFPTSILQGTYNLTSDPGNGVSGEFTGNFTFDATSTIDQNISGPSNSNWFVTELSSNFYITSSAGGYHGVSANGTTGWAQVGGNGSWNAQYSEPIVSFSNDSILWCTGFILYSFDGTTTSAITTGKEGENCYSIYKDATYYYLRTSSGIYRSTSLTTGWTSVYSGSSASYEGGLRFNDNVTFIWDKGYLWTSTNGGASFTRAFGGLSGLDYNPTNDYWMKMKWVTNGFASYSISQDDGATWTTYIQIDQDGSGSQPIDRARELKYIGGDKWLMLSDDNDTSLKGLYSVTSPKLTWDGFYQGWTKEFALTGAARKMSIENYDTLFITELGTVIGSNVQTKIHKFDLERS